MFRADCNFFTVINLSSRFNSYPNSRFEKNDDSTIDLISCGFHNFPRTFHISTNNGAFSFNVEILKTISPIIQKKLECHPDQTEFHIWVDDTVNAMQKFEDLLRLLTVEISQAELPIFRQICATLKIKFPKFKDSNSSTFQIEFSKSEAYRIFQQENAWGFNPARQFQRKVLSIESNGKLYECNLNGAYSSNVIKAIFDNNPKSEKFEYDLKDGEDFSIIQQLFNFESIPMNPKNMEILEKVCSDLQIDCIQEKVEQFNQSFSDQLLLAESKDHLVEATCNLFESLYSIGSNGSKKTYEYLLTTEWVHGESNIVEMISCILQVIRTNIRLHSDIVELILLLDKEFTRSNRFDQFLSILTNRLLNESNKYLLYGAFLYKLYESQIISFEQIRVQYIKSSQSNIIGIFFLPEFEECGIKLDANTKLPYDSNQYHEMRKDFEPLNDILRLIIQDDAEKLQVMISQNNIDINKSVHLDSLINRQSKNSEVSLIDYAAENGSINCYKYLLLNHAEISRNLMPCAVKGGNTEIIRISHSKMMESFPDIINRHFRQNKNQIFLPCQLDIYVECLIIAIKTHRYSLIDWILDQIEDINQLFKHLKKLYHVCTTNGNIQAIRLFMKHGINIPDFLDNIKQYNQEERRNCVWSGGISSTQSLNNTKLCFDDLLQHGFYHFLRFLFELKNQKTINYLTINDPSIVIQSRNPKILNVLTNLPVDKIFYAAIESGDDFLVDYIMKNLHYFNESTDYSNIYLSLVTTNSTSMFKLIALKYRLEQSQKFLDVSQYLAIICKACEYSAYEFVRIFTNFLLSIDKDAYFTKPFKMALSSKSSHICDFFIRKNINLDLIEISSDPNLIMLDNGKFVLLLFEAADKYLQLPLFNSLLYNFISSPLNKHQEEYMRKLLSLNKSERINSILKEISLNSPFVYSIIRGNSCAVNIFICYLKSGISNLIEQINFGLKYMLKNASIDSLPNIYKLLSGIDNVDLNLKYENETFLTLAIKQSNLVLTQLCLDNIQDQTIFDQVSLENPFIIAIRSNNIKIVNLFIDYFGDNISKQASQINLALSLVIEDYSNDRDGFDNTPSPKSISIILKRLYELTNVEISIKLDAVLTLAALCSDVELTQFCLDNMKDKRIFDQVSMENPFIYAIKSRKINIINLFIDYFGDTISKQALQIIFGLNLLLEDCDTKIFDINSNPSSPTRIRNTRNYVSDVSIILKRLLAQTNVDTIIKYDKFLMDGVKLLNVELVQFCLENMKDQSIFDQVSMENPFVYAIKSHKIEIINRFIEYFGDNISKQESQINFALNLLLEDFSNDRCNSNDKTGYHTSVVLKRLYELANVELKIKYDVVFRLAIKRSDDTLAQFCLDNMKDQRIFSQVSLENPFVYAIKSHSIEIVNLFINYFGENISQQTSQINLGLTLLLEDYYNHAKPKSTRVIDPMECNSNDRTEEYNSICSYYKSHNFIIFIKRLFELENADLNIRHRNETFLTLAVKRSEAELVQCCLENMKDQAIFDQVSMKNPFVYAIKSHKIEIVNLFIVYFGENISKLTSQINFGLNLLLEDCSNYRKSSGDNSNFSHNRFCVEDSSSTSHNDILSFLSQFFLQVPNFDHDILFKICSLNGDVGNFLFLQKYLQLCDTKNGNTLLMNSIIHNKPKIATLFAQSHRVDYKMKNKNNETALTLALDQMNRNNETDYYQLIDLLAAKIDRDELNRVFYFCNDTTAQKLKLYKELDVNYAHVTVSKISDSMPKLDDSSSMHQQNHLFHRSCAKKDSSSLIKAFTTQYSTSLLHSIEMGHYIKSKLIIEHPRFDPDLSNVNEAAFLVITKKNYEIFNQLLDFVDINILNSKGQPLLALCCEYNFIEGVHRILNDSQFDPVKIDFSTVFLTVLQGYSNSYINIEILKALVDYDSKHLQFIHFGQLLPNGKSVFTQITTIQQSYYYANPCRPGFFNSRYQSNAKEIDEGTSQYIGFLLDHGADPNKPDLFGVYPLQHAIQIESIPLVKVLLNSGKINYSVKINTDQIKNGTYFHLTAFASAEITDQLTSRGIFDPDAKDDLGHTADMIRKMECEKRYNFSYCSDDSE